MIIDHIFCKENMIRAAKKVKEKKSVGIDGISARDAIVVVEKEYENTIKALRDGSYKPNMVKVVEIPKDNGGKRSIAICTTKDRCILYCLNEYLYKEIQPHLSDLSFAYRSDQGCGKAIQKLLQYIDEGYTYFLKLDIKKFFDSIKHDTILYKLKTIGIDRDIIQLVNRYLKIKYSRQSNKPNKQQGCPQGLAISPILSELVLDTVDREMINRNIKFLRYADDIVIAYGSRNAASNGMRSVSSLLWSKCKLTFNDKSSISHVSEDINILGFIISKDPLGVTHIRVRQSSIDKFKVQIEHICLKENCPDNIVKEINQEISGWVMYFKIADIGNVTSELDVFIENALSNIEHKKNISINRTKLKSCHEFYLHKLESTRNIQINTVKFYV